jgi:hypothetical protein
VFSIFARKAAGALDAPGIPCALIFRGTRKSKQNSRGLRGGIVGVWLSEI